MSTDDTPRPTTDPVGRSSDEQDAIQAVVDRVSSYQDGATDGTVDKELRAALDEAGIDLPDEEITRLAAQI